jgi:hypothetical protein
MSAFKSLTSQDVIITPLVVNKRFSFTGTASIESPDVEIDRFIGINIPESVPFNPDTDPTTGQISTQYQRLVYNSIKQLYYSNELPNSEGTIIVTDLNGNIVESNLTTDVHSRFDNYLQTTLSQSRSFPTGAYDQVGIVAIPKKLFGDYIVPGSVRYIAGISTGTGLFISASLVNGLLIKKDINDRPLINGSGSDVNPINWSLNTDTVGWFDGGIIEIPEIAYPYTVEITASFPASSGSLYVSPQNYSNPTSSYTVYDDDNPITVDGTNYPNAAPFEYVIEPLPTGITMSLAIDNGDNTYTPVASSSITFLTGSSVSMSFNYTSIDENTNYVLIPQFNGSDTEEATIFTNVIMRLTTTDTKVDIRDNGEGNLYAIGTLLTEPVGIVVYTHGMVLLTDQALMTNFTSSTSTINFQSARTIYETQYKCTIRENEFNYSLNPSLISSSTFVNPLLTSGSISTLGQVYDFVTGSFFSPYITTVGLYNDNNELLAVAKLSQPLPTSRTTDMSILVNLDM